MSEESESQSKYFFCRAILQNRKIIQVNQDRLGIQGRRIYKVKNNAPDKLFQMEIVLTYIHHELFIFRVFCETYAENAYGSKRVRHSYKRCRDWDQTIYDLYISSLPLCASDRRILLTRISLLLVSSQSIDFLKFVRR